MAVVQLFKIVAVLVACLTVINANPLLYTPGTCNADTCARQVAGTASQPARTLRASDCASFLATTFVPSPAIVTTTSTLMAGRETPNPFVGSTPITTAYSVTGTFIPGYIDQCGSGRVLAARYSSACACFPSLTRATITAARPTVTLTSYISDPSFAVVRQSVESHSGIHLSGARNQGALQKIIRV